MPRGPRLAPSGYFFHILNRASGSIRLFEGAACYREFVGLIAECAEAADMRILAFCLMPNHWHMLVCPRHDDDLRRFVHRLSVKHSHRWHLRNDSVGRGHLYQNRYKSFLVQDDAHLLTVCRYIERNPVRAGLVEDASKWPWSSAPLRLRRMVQNGGSDDVRPRVNLEPLPVELPNDWLSWVNEPQTDAELHFLRAHVQSGAPFGRSDWRVPGRTGKQPAARRRASLPQVLRAVPSPE